jgi:carboxymethylenebutenolidase
MGTKTIEFSRPDGKKAPAYLALPEAGDKAPAVVVIQEWWGLNEQIKGVADRLARAGYRALVPDLFRGKITTSQAEAKHMMTGLDFPQAANQDIRGAVQHLKERSPSKVAVLGFCMGGALTIISAVKAPEVDAGVCFYGIPPKQVADPSTLKVPIQCHFGTRDEFWSREAIDDLEASLKAGHVNHEFFRYEKAQHAFTNEMRPEVYDPAAAKLAWERALAFLAKNLR